MKHDKLLKHLDWLFSEEKITKLYNQCNPNLPSIPIEYFEYWVKRIFDEYPGYFKIDEFRDKVELIRKRVQGVNK